jgi:hypothetical protein
MPNGTELEAMRKRLASITGFEYSVHADRDAMSTRRIAREQVGSNLMAPKALLIVEPQPDGRYRLVFASTKRKYLTIIVRFIDGRLRIITTYQMSVRRYRRYLRWLRKKRR